MKKNKLISRTKKDIKVNEKENVLSQIEEPFKKVNLSIREFKCECGISVRLEGDIAKDNRITKCSICRK